MKTSHIKVTKDGPYLTDAGLPLEVMSIGVNGEGGSWEWLTEKTIPTEGPYALCRCGGSEHKPFCDGTHQTIAFDGTETASRKPFDTQASVIEGPTMVLQDAESLCAFARFCDNAGTIWTLINETDDDAAREIVAHEESHCPSGRLVVRDLRTGQIVEPALEPSIVLIEDPVQNCSGPIWARGRILIEAADGTPYELRNRVTLCRCGASENKPFCDGRHAEVRFVDGL